MIWFGIGEPIARGDKFNRQKEDGENDLYGIIPNKYAPTFEGDWQDSKQKRPAKLVNQKDEFKRI